MVSSRVHKSREEVWVRDGSGVSTRLEDSGLEKMKERSIYVYLSKSTTTNREAVKGEIDMKTRS